MDKFISNLYFGVRLSDEEMRQIPHPRAELHYHVLYKNLQMGAILGMGVIGPIVGLVKGRSLSAAVKYASKGGKVGCAILVPLAPVMTEAAIRNADEEAIYDRCYRIRYNRGQMNADRFSTLGALTGAGAALSFSLSLTTCMIAGFGLGCVTGGIYTAATKEEK